MAEAFLGFTPSTFTDDVFNSVDAYVADAMDQLEKEVERQLGIGGRARKSAAARSELHEGCDALTSRLQEVFHLNVDKFELYVLKNLFVMPEASDEQEHAEEQGDDEKALEQSEEEAAALAAELEELKASVAKARSKHRALLSIKRLYEKRLPAARSSAQALKDAMGTLATPETSTGGGGEEASRPGPSTQATVADLVSEAAEVAAMCGRLSAAAGDQSGGNSGSSKRGRSRQSFGGVLSQYERDVKTMGGGVRGKGKK